jgi:hypothetical protein
MRGRRRGGMVREVALWKRYAEGGFFFVSPSDLILVGVGYWIWGFG